VYVCICKGITEGQLKEAVGARKNQSVKDVMKTLGVGSDCGTCVEDAVRTLLDAQGQAPRHAHEPASQK